MSETRKLAAILCSDVVGYSRLAGGLARLHPLGHECGIVRGTCQHGVHLGKALPHHGGERLVGGNRLPPRLVVRRERRRMDAAPDLSSVHSQASPWFCTNRSAMRSVWGVPSAFTRTISPNSAGLLA